MTPVGGVSGSLTHSGSGRIIVNPGVALTNDGTTGTGAPDGEVVLLDSTTSSHNSIELLTGASLSLTGGTNGTVFVSNNVTGNGGIKLATGSTISKSGNAAGNAIYARTNVVITNNGTITASSGTGTILYEANNNFNYSGSGNVTNTGGNDGNDDAIRVVGSGLAVLEIGGNISSAAGGSALDLSAATGSGQSVIFTNSGGSTGGGILLGGGTGTAALTFNGTGDSVITGMIGGTASATTTLTVQKTSGKTQITGAVTEVDNLNVTSGMLDLDGAGSSFGKAFVAADTTLDISSINGSWAGTLSWATVLLYKSVPVELFQPLA
jgi:hypothetical protein